VIRDCLNRPAVWIGCARITFALKFSVGEAADDPDEIRCRALVFVHHGAPLRRSCMICSLSPPYTPLDSGTREFPDRVCPDPSGYFEFSREISFAVLTAALFKRGFLLRCCARAQFTDFFTKFLSSVAPRFMIGRNPVKRTSGASLSCHARQAISAYAARLTNSSSRRGPLA